MWRIIMSGKLITIDTSSAAEGSVKKRPTKTAIVARDHNNCLNHLTVNRKPVLAMSNALLTTGAYRNSVWLLTAIHLLL